MDKRLIHINPTFQEWLDQLLKSEKMDLFVLYKLKQDGVIAEPFEVKIGEPRVGRRAVINRPSGYLTFEKNIAAAVGEEFLFFGRNALQERKYTTAGLANFLILL